MRIEQTSKGRFIKRPDRLTQYMMRVIQRFFETDKEMINTNESREAIVNEATRRAGAEIVRSVQKIVIEETNEYAATELNQAIDMKLGEIVNNLNDKVDEIISRQISYDKYQFVIDEPTSVVTVTGVIDNVKVSNDIILMFINGVLHEDVTLEHAGGILTNINLGDVVLETDDIFFVGVIRLNPKTD